MSKKRYMDITGMRFGRLVAVERVGSDSHRSSMWRCKCDCGNETVTRITRLRSGAAQSCGCRHREIVSANKIHGDSNKPLYNVWRAMKQRCLNERCRVYPLYGGRGISVCEEWVESYPAFKEWAMSNGYARGLTIDRIDNDGNYEPSNCRWVGMDVQSKNRRIPKPSKALCKPVEAMTTDGAVVLKFDSVKDAGAAMSSSPTAWRGISGACHGKRKTSYGYLWRFADVY